MKAFVKILIIVLAVSFSLANTSCAKKSHAFRSNSGTTSSYDPVATKHQPVRKKYIVNNKRKTILGHETPPRSN